MRRRNRIMPTGGPVAHVPPVDTKVKYDIVWENEKKHLLKELKEANEKALQYANQKRRTDQLSHLVNVQNQRINKLVHEKSALTTPVSINMAKLMQDHEQEIKRVLETLARERKQNAEKLKNLRIVLESKYRTETNRLAAQLQNFKVGKQSMDVHVQKLKKQNDTVMGLVHNEINSKKNIVNKICSLKSEIVSLRQQLAGVQKENKDLKKKRLPDNKLEMQVKTLQNKVNRLTIENRILKKKKLS